MSVSQQVDIMQMCVIEMINRPGKPLFHLENFIEGEYVKYNSNSGYVFDDDARATPQVWETFLTRLFKTPFFIILLKKEKNGTIQPVHGDVLINAPKNIRL